MKGSIVLSLILAFSTSIILYATTIDAEKEPIVLKKVEAKYPEKAYREKIEGQVVVAVLVDVDGKPKDVRVVKTSNEIFNDAAMEAAKQWLFGPAILNKKPVKFWFQIPISFKLEKNGSFVPADTLIKITKPDSKKISDSVGHWLKPKENEAVVVYDDRSGSPGNPVAIRKDAIRKDAMQKDAVISVPHNDYVPAYGEPQQVDEGAALLHRREPNYPPIAYANKIEGRVILAILLGFDGKVLDTKVVQSSNEIFNQDAIDCVKKWAFKPAILKGNPIKFWYTDSLDFRIK